MLKAVTRKTPWNAALVEGRVRPDGYDLAFEEVDPLIRAFRRMVRELAFDVTEMAFTTYLCAKEHGARFTALPVFLVREFHHKAWVVPAGSALAPAQLEGRRVGVNRGYTVTTGVWARGVLATEHGVDLSRVTWAPTGDEHVAEYQPPANVEPPAGGDLVEQVRDGAVAAGVGLASGDGVESLLADPDEAGFAALRERGHYPINHLVVVKDELLDADPALAPALFEAFVESKREYVDLSPLHARVAEITGGDPLPYGIEPNRGPIEELLDHALSQRILRRRPELDELFAAGTLDLTG